MNQPVVTRRTIAAAALGAMLADLVGAQTRPSDASDFPNRAVRLVVPTPPGSAPDIRARQIAQKLAEDWQQPVVVDNRPGASGSIAMESVARAPADGHTLVLGNISYLAVLPHLSKLPIDALKDLVPVSQVTAGPLVLVAHGGVPFNSLPGLIDHARANPGKLNATGGGAGSLVHLAVTLLNKTAGVDITFIPSKGGGLDTAAVIGGQVQLLFEFASVIGPHVKSGRLKALAVASDKRLAVLPEVPTFNELGHAGMQIKGWQGVLAPAGTPPELIGKLNRAIVKVLGQPDIREAILSTGGEVGGDSPEQFAAFIRAEHARWGKVITEAGIRLE
jgi:tripartite-type tricarboxylate transporter receptor subunit TctC